MKKVFASFGWILLLLPLISVAGARTAFIINKNLVSVDNRDLSGFNGISSGGSFKVYVEFGQKESLRLEGNEDVLKEIETKVENGILKIGFKKGYNSSFWGVRNGINIGRINVYITAIKLNNINSSGSGDIEVNGTVKTNNLQTAVSGSGSISLTIAADAYSATISGSGQTNAKGTTRTADIKVSGSGNFKGDLVTNNADVKVSGSGNVDIIADNALNAAVSGSGNIRYSGNATKVITSKSGSGRVSRM